MIDPYVTERQFYLDRLEWTVDDPTYSLGDLQEALFNETPQKNIVPKIISGATNADVDVKINAERITERARDSSIYAHVFGVDNPTGVAVTDTTNINAKLLAASNAGGGIVMLQLGTYVVNTQLVLGTNVTLQGAGAATIIQFTGDSNTDFLRNTGYLGAGNYGVTLRDFTLIGPEDGTHISPNGVNIGRGIVLRKCDDAIIQNLIVSRFWLQGIQINLSARVKITGNTVKEIKAGNGISLDEDATDCIIQGNTIKDVADCGIGIHNGCLRTIIVNNNVNGTAYGRGIDIYGAPETTASSNNLTNLGIAISGSSIGIQIQPGLAGQIPHRCVITTNTITSPADGIQIWGESATAINDTLIAANIINTPGANGISVYRNVIRTTIVGNIIRSAVLHGIAFGEGGGRIPSKGQVSANTINGCLSAGLWASASVTGITGAGNALLGNGVSIDAPGGNSIIYEDGDGYQKLKGGFTVGELYVTSFYPSGTFAHTGATIGFYGTAPITKPTAITVQSTGAPVGSVGTAAGGWDTAINRDAAITAINNNRTRLAELETKLRALGLIT